MPFSMVLHEISYPVIWVWHKSYHTVRDTWSAYLSLHGAAEENLALKGEIARLRALTLDYEEQVQQVSRLRQLVGFTEKTAGKIIVAEVLTGQKNSVFRSLRITKGSLDGVRPGMPVVAADGVVGRVLRTGLKMADLQLLVDFDFNVDVLVQRTRIRGVLSGYATETCRLQLPRGAEVRIGDTIITSGIVGSFPKGLPVGKVVKISYESDNVSQVITVEPWVDHRRLEEVVVLDRSDPELEKIIETAGADWLEKSLDRVNADSAAGG